MAISGCGKHRTMYLLFLVLFIFSGCSSHKGKSGTADKIDKFDKWKILAETSQPVTPVPEKKILRLHLKQKPEYYRKKLYLTQKRNYLMRTRHYLKCRLQ